MSEKLSKVLEEVWRFYEQDKQSLIEFFRSGYRHFHKEAKEKDADEMEKELNLKREAIEQLKQLIKAQAEPSEGQIEEKAKELVGWFHRWREQFPEENKDSEDLPLCNTKNMIRYLAREFSMFWIGESWLPTAKNIKALPEPVRKYIYELETNCDPPSLVRDNIIIKENIKALEIRLKEAEAKK